MNSSGYATACCIFHRFYSCESLQKYDVWSISMACLLIAGKIEDDCRSLRRIIICFIHLYRKRRLALNGENDFPKSCLAQLLTKEEKYDVLKNVPAVSPFG